MVNHFWMRGFTLVLNVAVEMCPVCSVYIQAGMFLAVGARWISMRPMRK